MIDLLKAYWPYIVGTLFLLVGHVPIRALLKPTKYSRADKILAAWEALSVDARKLAKSQGKKIPWLEPVVLVIDAIYPAPEQILPPPMSPPPDHVLVIDREPVEAITQPITIEPPPPEPPRAA